MKTFLSPHALLATVDEILAASPAFHRSPLHEVIEVLCRGRHYNWMGIYLVVNQAAPSKLLDAARDRHPAVVALPETRTKILITIKLVGREIGILDVESDHENAFGPEDRVLLEGVAHRLALFLTGPGKYLVRKAREKQTPVQPRLSAAA